MPNHQPSVSFLVYGKIYLSKSYASSGHEKIKYTGGFKMEKVTFCSTNAGNGFKIAVNDTWLYVSKKFLLEVIEGKAKSCKFSTYEEEGKE